MLPYGSKVTCSAQPRQPILLCYTGRGAQCPCSNLIERLHALETSPAVQLAIQAGAEAQVATQAGMMTTNAAARAATWTTMASGFVGLVVGIFLAVIIIKS